MNRSTNSFPRPSSLACLTFLLAVVALSALGEYAQTQVVAGPYQKASFKTARPCAVAATGEVTSLVKNGVELSVTEDWDCDGVPDAYDNCVGMPNRTQIDSDGSSVGDVCEAGVITRVPARIRSKTKIPVPAKTRSNTKPKSRKATAADKRPRPGARKRRGR